MFLLSNSRLRWWSPFVFTTFVFLFPGSLPAKSSAGDEPGLSISAYPTQVAALQELPQPGFYALGAALVTLDTGTGVGGDHVVFHPVPLSATFTSVIDHGDGTYSQRIYSLSENLGSSEVFARVNGELVPMTATFETVENWGGSPDLNLSEIHPFWSTSAIPAGSNEPARLAMLLYDGFGNIIGHEEHNVQFAVSRGTVGPVTFSEGLYSADWFPGDESGLLTATARVNGQPIERAYQLEVIDGPVASSGEWTEDYEEQTLYQGSEVDLTLRLLDQNGEPMTKGGESVIFRAPAWGWFIGSVVDHQDGTYTARLRAAGGAYRHLVEVAVNGQHGASLNLWMTPETIHRDRFEQR